MLLGALTSGVWKGLTAALGVVVVMLVVANHISGVNLEETKAALASKQQENSDLTAHINLQNVSIEKLALQKEEADKRARLAKELANAKGEHFKAVLDGIEGAVASGEVESETCEDVMPLVSSTLSSLKK